MAAKSKKDNEEKMVSSISSGKSMRNVLDWSKAMI